MGEVVLRQLTLNDVQDRYHWMCDPEVTKYLNVPDKNPPFSIEETQEWINACIDRSNGYFQRAIMIGQTHVGWVDLKNIDHLNRQAELGISIGNKNYWGRGYGRRALIKMLDIGFKEFSLNKVWLRVDFDNTNAINCYEKAGFKHEGILREDRLRKGLLIDRIRMSILKREFESVSRMT